MSEKLFPIIMIALVAVVLVGVTAVYLPFGIDWHGTYRPAALALLSGKSPYSVDIYYAAPWGLVPLLPLALLPESLGRAILLLVSIIAFAYTAQQLGAKPLALAVFLLSPPVVHCLLNANIEWMPLLGFVLPPQWGLLFVIIKPQIGIAVAVYWLFSAWQAGRFREVVRVFWPVSLITLVSFGLFGFWPMRFRETLVLTHSYNASLWPSSIPVGLALLVAAIRTRQIRYAMGASPCLSPYVLLHAWSGALVALSASNAEMIAAVVGLWVLVILRAMTGVL